MRSSKNISMPGRPEDAAVASFGGISWTQARPREWEQIAGR